eukprot:gb/GECG01012579.1/.p1 GENE.gb/GECG01012579.1/~~gb/GECG01012579.1/.p1  ORF type:complete len:225 (+),score=38.14 gb/GECG01012579.1/:1-675(+)
MNAEGRANRKAQDSHFSTGMSIPEAPKDETSKSANPTRARKLEMEKGSVGSIFADGNATSSKEHFRTTVQASYDEQESSVLSSKYQKSQPPERLSKGNKDRANFTLGEEETEFQSTMHSAWKSAQESPPPPHIYTKPFQLESKKTNESYNIVNGEEQSQDFVEKQFRFGGARANNDKYRPERTPTHEYDPIRGTMTERSKAPPSQDVSGVPPLRSAPGLRPPSE